MIIKNLTFMALIVAAMGNFRAHAEPTNWERLNSLDAGATYILTQLTEPPASIGFATSSVSIPEFESEAKVEVRRGGNLEIQVSVDYSTVSWNGAVSGQDYTEVSGTLRFLAGQKSEFIRVPILNDGEPEPLQGVQIILSNPSAGVTMGLTSSIVRIIDNDNQNSVGPLIAAVGGQVYGDWSLLNVRWGQGYPAVNVRFDADASITGQSIWDNHIVRGSNMNDQPEFMKVYTTNLHMNALVADFGRVKMTYDLAFDTELLDLMILDVDEQDHVEVACHKADGTLINPALLAVVMQGDLSRNFNAPGRPPSEPATPPVWDPVTGTLVAGVTWNENRSYTILRSSVPLHSITLTFTGKRTGAHIYSGLWATPRAFELTGVSRTIAGDFRVRWNSLPAVPYRIMHSANLVEWVEAWAAEGAASPVIATEIIVPIQATPALRFFRIQRF